MNLLHHIWFTYCYPSLLGNGPEDAIRTAIALVLAVVLVPRIRHWFEGHMASLKAHITAEHKAAREHAERLHGELHDRLDREGK